jgi:exopolysaccharide biosynthesis polyprenyl glycosylphosphotransferase
MIRFFSILIPTSILGLLVSEFLLILALYTIAAAFLVEYGLWLFFSDQDGLVRILVVVLSIIGGLYLNDLYTQIKVRSRILLVQQVCLSVGITFLVQALIAYSNLYWRMPRMAMLAGSLGCIFVLPLWRVSYSRTLLKIFGAERLLMVGDTALVRQVGSYLLEHPELAMLPLGVVTDGKPTPEGKSPLETLGPVEQLEQIVARVKPSRIIVGIEDGGPPVHELLDARQHGLNFEDISVVYETALGRVCLNRLGPEDMLFGDRFRPSRRQLIVQTAYSFAVAVVGVVLTAPVMLMVALAVRLTSPGPVLFRQRRVGKDNSTFNVYKFRSMYVDAEARTGAVWAQKNDPRVTPIGRWLRLLRLDELPQLFNVLAGQMAIVGPRPERPEFVKPLGEQIPFYVQRHSVKPGITGWAQINYKYGNTLEDTVIKLEYDLYYIKNLSFALDFFIMFHTVKTMLLTRGAA